jgi:hypothetical protein
LHKRLSVRGLFPALIVSAVIGLAALAPSGAALNSILASLGYSYAGPWTSGPDASGQTSTNMDVFIAGANGTPFDIHWDGSNFSGATSLSGTIIADPGAVTNPATARTDLFVTGVDGALYHKIRTSGTWGPWLAFTGVGTSGPDASLRVSTPGTVDVWVRGTDLALYHRWSTDGGNTWSGWESQGGTLSTDARAVSWNANRVDVFAGGTDHQLYHKWWNLVGGWSNWEALGGYLTSAPDAASCASGHLDVFVRGTDNAIYTKGWNGTMWSAYSRLGGLWTSNPSALCRPGTSLIDVFARDNSGNLSRAFEVTAS